MLKMSIKKKIIQANENLLFCIKNQQDICMNISEVLYGIIFKIAKNLQVAPKKRYSKKDVILTDTKKLGIVYEGKLEFRGSVKEL